MEEQATSLTPFERLSLMNQLSILKRPDPENAEDYDDDIKILHSGFTILYNKVFTSVFEEMPVEEGQYVFDVLEMHGTLIHSFKELKDKQGLTAEDVRFKGFDGNDETNRMAFAEYLQEKGKWHETLVGDMDSHSIMTMKRYPQMLERCEPIKRQITDRLSGEWQLTAEQIKTVIGKED